MTDLPNSAPVYTVFVDTNYCLCFEMQLAGGHTETTIFLINPIKSRT